jgi:hypothetical protein
MWGSFAEMQGSLCENVNVESSKCRSWHAQKEIPTFPQKKPYRSAKEP